MNDIHVNPPDSTDTVFFFETTAMISTKEACVGLMFERTAHHRARIRLAYAHYREVVKEADDVVSYWNLLPSGVVEIVKFAA